MSNPVMIQISEQDLRRIVNDIAYRLLRMNEPLPSMKDILPYNEETQNIIEQVPEDELKTSLIDYRCIQEGFSYDDFAGLMLTEGIFATFPVDTTINYIRRHFRIPELMIGKSTGHDGQERINVTIATINDNYEVLNRLMHLCGYYRAYPACKDEEIPKNMWVNFQFEPNKPAIDNSVLAGETTLLHITSFERAEKIMKQGFVPKSKNRAFNYPERIYFLKGSMKSEWKRVAAMLCAAAETVPYVNGEELKREYSCITVNINKIPGNIRFYKDANFKGGVYTEDYIPASVIENIENEWITVRR